MSKKNPILDGDWPWRYYLYLALSLAASIGGLICGYGWHGW